MRIAENLKKIEFFKVAYLIIVGKKSVDEAHKCLLTTIPLRQFMRFQLLKNSNFYNYKG